MNDLLGKRMKEQYEDRFRYKLLRRTPTIIRIDGKAFHTYTRGLNKPFDEGLIEDMQETMRFLCKNIQGCKMGYCQSDEISLLITDYATIETSAWFDYNLQKMCSVSASLATFEFNRLRLKRMISEDKKIHLTDELQFVIFKGSETLDQLLYDLDNIKLANFDSRVFQISDHEEVVNYFIWRYFDAIKNSVSMLAQSSYSPKELIGKNTTIKKEMCMIKGQAWDDLHWSKKSGSLCVYNNQNWEIIERTVNTEFRLFVLELLKNKE